MDFDQNICIVGTSFTTQNLDFDSIDNQVVVNFNFE